jgi:hypothetical protein
MKDCFLLRSLLYNLCSCSMLTLDNSALLQSETLRLTKLFFSISLPAQSGPRPLIQFRNYFSQTVGLLGRVISPSQGPYLHTGQHKQNKRIHTPNIHAFSGIRTHDPISCLRLRGYSHRAIQIKSADFTSETRALNFWTLTYAHMWSSLSSSTLTFCEPTLCLRIFETLCILFYSIFSFLSAPAYVSWKHTFSIQ